MSGILIDSGVNPSEAKVDTNALRTQLYDAAGNPVLLVDRAALGFVPNTTKGLPSMLGDWKTPILQRCMSDGGQPSGPQLLFEEQAEGVALNTTTKWNSILTTQTIAQGTAGSIVFNSGNSAATGTGSMLQSIRRFGIAARQHLIWRARLRKSAHQTNTITENGFGAPATAITPTAGDGAFLRKDVNGLWSGVLSVGGVEVLTAVTMADAAFIAKVPIGTNFTVEVEIDDQKAQFRMFTAVGELFFNAIQEFAAAAGSFQTNRLGVFVRTWNNGAASGPEQITLGACSVHQSGDSELGLSSDQIAAEQGDVSLSSPVTPFASLANYTNSVAPTARTLSNTAAGETTLGGLLSVTAMATGAPTDLLMFGWQNTGNRTFMFRGIRIPAPLNQVAAVATTATVFAYALGFNSTAVSLATAGIKFVALSGFHSAAVALGVNAQFSGNEIVFTPNTPIPIFPGRFLQLMCRCIVGTATATETFLWSVPIDGYFR